MTIRTTRWEPDTHSVVIDYEWDDALPDDQRVHTPVRAWTKMPPGNAVPLLPHRNPVALHDQVLTENRRKNEAIAHVLDALPEAMTKDELDSDGDPTGRRVVKDKHAPEWTMGKDGRVTISIPGADKASKTALRAGLAEKFGSTVTLDA